MHSTRCTVTQDLVVNNIMPTDEVTRTGERKWEWAKHYSEKAVYYMSQAINMMKDDTTPHVPNPGSPEERALPSEKYANQRKLTVCRVLKSMWNADQKGTRQQFGDDSAFVNALKSGSTRKNSRLMKYFDNTLASAVMEEIDKHGDLVNASTQPNTRAETFADGIPIADVITPSFVAKRVLRMAHEPVSF